MRVSIDERLARLCADFSVAKVGEWLERKFASYDTSRAEPISIAENKNDKEYFKSARLLGYVKELPAESAGGRTRGDAMNKPLLVAVVEMRKILTERTSRQAQFNFAKRVLQNAVRSGAAGLNGYPSQGLFFFYDQDRFFRISLVTGEMDGRKFKFNEAKRQSFYINPDRPNNVAKSRLSEPIETYADLKEAFSVETLTKEFYGKLFAWYEWAMKPKTGVTFPNDDSTPDDDRKYNNESIIRLITRLMFTWFIRQRDMVRKELFTVEGVGALLKGFDAKSMDDDNYYRCILQNLFFATFNCQPEKRGFIKHKQGNGYSDQHNVKTFYRYEKEFKDPAAFKELVKKTPFLNCALFDCLDKQQREVDGGKLLLFDGFSDSRKRQAHVPNGLFFHPEKGIIPLFDTYEFTIDENNADDADVALDPELLGKVFENLLGAYNPETCETARKATGSFYTPREIVDYMVEESLKNYLKEKVKGIGQGQEWNARLDDLFDKTAAAEKRELPFGEDVAAKMREALYDCKILDPACGSGAFPMGILHCMVRLFSRLDPSNTDLNKRLIMRYKQETNQPPDPLETAAEREERLAALKVQLDEGQHYPDYARKLYLIENCIYGVDIQPIATQISKLRFFISLLCDQLRENWNADGENHGLLSLPNLEAKFVCANTLIALPKTEGELELMSCSKIPKLREKLQQNRHRIFAARTYKQKEKLKARDLEIRDEIRDAVRSTLAKPDKELIKVQEGIIAKLRKDREQYETPKMVKQQKAVQDDFFAATQDTLTFEMVDANKPKRDQIDAQIDFAQRKIDSELAKSSASNVTKIDQLATLVAGWDPYDQNASSPFFDPEWMFNLSGFDVVIGNPPYIRPHHLSSECKNILWKQFSTFEKKADIYVCFMQRGLQVLADKATLSYIVSDGWLRLDSFVAIRKYLLENAAIKRVVDFSDDVFDSATVKTCIVVARREKEVISNNIVEAATVRRSEQLSCLPKVHIPQSYFSNAYKNVFDLSYDPVNRTIKDKLEGGARRLGDCYELSFGLKTGDDEKFLTRDPLAKFSKKLIRGADAGRYFYNFKGEYVIYLPEEMRKNKITARPGSRERFEQPKVLLRDTGGELMGVYDEDNFYVKDMIVVSSASKDQVALKKLLALLNSKAMKYYYETTYPTLHVQRDEVASLPVNEIFLKKENKRVVSLVDRILAAKKNDPDADTTALEAEIDQLVYKLYGLTEEEIAIVEGREEKAKAKGEGEEKVKVRGEGGARRRGARGSAAVGGASGGRPLPDDDEELE